MNVGYLRKVSISLSEEEIAKLLYVCEVFGIRYVKKKKGELERRDVDENGLSRMWTQGRK